MGTINRKPAPWETGSEFDDKQKQEQKRRSVDMQVRLIIGGIIGFLAVVAFLIINPIVMIGAGQRGVILEWGAVSDKVLSEGISFVTPISQSVKKMDVTVQKHSAKTSSSSKDLQVVTTEVTINYRIDPTKVNKVYQSYRRDYETILIEPAMHEFLKQATARYTAEELVTKREAVKDRLKIELATTLAQSGIILDDIFITDFEFSPEFNKSIEAKVQAEQDAQKEKNNLAKVQFQAQQRIAQAKAEAEAIKIQAEAVTQKGGKDYVQLKAVEKWNGVLPTQMIPGSTVPFINLKAVE